MSGPTPDATPEVPTPPPAQPAYEAPAPPPASEAPAAPPAYAAPAAPPAYEVPGAPPAYQPPAAQPGAYPAAPYGTPPPYATAPAYAPAPYGGYPTTPKTNTLAIVSLVASIVGFIWILPFIGSLAGAICGHISLGQIKRTGEGGRGMALAGVIVGWAGLGLFVIGIIILVAILSIAAATYPSSGNPLVP